MQKMILMLLALCCCLLFVSVIDAFHMPLATLRLNKPRTISNFGTMERLFMTEIQSNGAVVSETPSPSGEQEAPVVEETPEEKYRREKLEEIAELKAKEVFVSRSTGKYECQACGYVYDESKGNAKKGYTAGTPFAEIPKFRCPSCGASRKYFVEEKETLSGFKENLKYGLGTNAMTSGQKSLLIFGGLLVAVAVFMSGYLLE